MPGTPNFSESTPERSTPLHRAVCSDGHLIDGPWFEHEHGMLVIPCRRRVMLPRHASSTLLIWAIVLAFVGLWLRLDAATMVAGVGLAGASLLAFLLSGLSRLYSGEPAFFVSVSPHLLQTLKIRPMGFHSHWVSFGRERITAVMNPADFQCAQVMARGAGYPYRSVQQPTIK